MGYTGTHERYVNFFEQAEIARFSPDERKDYRESQKDFWDMCAVTETAEKKGRAEGRAEGLEEGLEKGRAEGRAEGVREGLLMTARNMKAAGMTNDTISRVTGLTADEIEKA